MAVKTDLGRTFEKYFRSLHLSLIKVMLLHQPVSLCSRLLPLARISRLVLGGFQVITRNRNAESLRSSKVKFISYLELFLVYGFSFGWADYTTVVVSLPEIISVILTAVGQYRWILELAYSNNG